MPVSMPVISLRTVPIDQIESFAEECARTQADDGVVPISRSRARAWAHNPRALPDDPAMLVAFQGDRCVGHLGMYPDLLLAGSRRVRVFWLSTFFVHPGFRASGAGPMLLMRALALDQHLGVSNPSPEAARIYQALRFHEPSPVRYCRLAIARLNLPGMPLRILRRLAKGILGREPLLFNRPMVLAQALTRAVVYPMLDLPARRRAGRMAIERLNVISGDLAPPLPEDAAVPRFDRSDEFFNWMLRHPWVSTEARDLMRNNHFSDVQERFATEAVRFVAGEDSRPVGSLVFRVSRSGGGDVFRVLGFSAAEPRLRPRLTAAIISLACRRRPDVLDVPAELGADVAEIPGMRALLQWQDHRYFFHARRGDAETAKLLRGAQLRYLDGDIAFT